MDIANRDVIQKLCQHKLSALLWSVGNISSKSKHKSGGRVKTLLAPMLNLHSVCMYKCPQAQASKTFFHVCHLISNTV